MAMDNRLGKAISRMFDDDDVAWFVKCLTLADCDERGLMPRQIEIAPRFHVDLLTTFKPGEGGAIPLDLASHGQAGSAASWMDRDRARLKLELSAGEEPEIEACGRPIVLALHRDDPARPLWAWVCRTDEEHDCADEFFFLWEEQVNWRYQNPREALWGTFD